MNNHNAYFMHLDEQIHVDSEIGRLRKLIIHSPDGGIGKVVPAKFKEWLYDDTVHLSQMRREYNQYVTLLLYFLDEDKAKLVMEMQKIQPHQQDCFKPDNPAYFNSDKVLDTQFLLSRILEVDTIRQRIISAVCAWEGTSSKVERKLMDINSSSDLAKALITGSISDKKKQCREFIFAPLPNFIFTRDIAITINDHLLLSNAATAARERESLLMKFIAQYALFENKADHLIEVTEPGDFFLLSAEDQMLEKTSLEGGDVMMISPAHILIGCSERTTAAAINEVIHQLFSDNKTGIEKISVIKIPRHRAMMHIDTVFTQVSKDCWVLFGQFSERYLSRAKSGRFEYSGRLLQNNSSEKGFKIEILRYYKPLSDPYLQQKDYEQNITDKISGLESLLREISEVDFDVDPEKVQIIYSGNNTFPFDEREQWTDSCNLLALKEGVVVGYDRNDLTINCFKEKGFAIKSAEYLCKEFENKSLTPNEVENTLILLPSAELSRARGGAHCMSLPLLRDSFSKY